MSIGLKYSTVALVSIGFCLVAGERLLAEAPKYSREECKKPTVFEEDLIKPAKKEIKKFTKALAVGELDSCKEIPKDLQEVKDTEYSPKLKEALPTNHKIRILDKHINRFSRDFIDAKNEYFEELVPKIDKIFVIANNTSKYKGCADADLKKEIGIAHEYHINVLRYLLPSTEKSLENSSMTANRTEQFKALSEKLKEELSENNQRNCKDQETQKDKGLPPIIGETDRLLKKQEAADKRARSKAEPRTSEQDEIGISADFGRSQSRSQNSGKGQGFPSEHRLKNQFKPAISDLTEDGKPSSSYDDMVAWHKGGVAAKRSQSRPVSKSEENRTRKQEQSFASRHKEWTSERNNMIDRVKNNTGMRADGFAKKMEYTFNTIQEINKQLIEILEYKDTICESQKEEIACPKFSR